MTEAEMDAIVAAADRVGAWILADEVYRGAERLQDEETRSFFGRYDKVLAVGSMSKAYGLPGLRVGWVVGPAGHGRRHLASPRIHNYYCQHVEQHPGNACARSGRKAEVAGADAPIYSQWFPGPGGRG